MQPKIILASKSPRRQELFKLVVKSHGIKDFIIQVAEIDEKRIETEILANSDEDFQDAVKILVEELAARKARVVQKINPRALVVGADTIVVIDEQILGKPADEMDAYNMIKRLAGNTHQVFTGVSIRYRDLEERFIVNSTIKFYEWDHQMQREVADYVASGKAMDKAGAYGIQEEAGLWVKWIKGDYNNIVGLPIAKLNKRFGKMLAQIANQ
ncbi:MAG: nucleoside triphosphate pyrophosphatase [Acetobacterium sp.]|uniref:Maf family protein n=1 Tax=Acetobacterium TaxID=33951 RepID=UPI0029E09032|nr:Maf family protein [Acetobacterium sp. K1/6]MDK2943027.1 nucleoside triphosphate pyrophosphatase [Acetobacterium sp.]MDZ5724501.1 Maf family protein [Acetobacterium sp. K1/6]